MNNNRKALILAGVACAAITSGWSSGAFAQEAETTASDSQVVVVTGTRIRRPNLKSASPITTVDDREVKLQGAIAVDTVLKTLPQIEAGNNENQSNNSDGKAGVNLRSLGGNRSLVLIDGQRFLPAEGVDLNFIPSALVERTDVLTGGASSVYGSDAMSGVVNFVMRKRLKGIRLDAQYSIYQHNNDDDYLRSVHKAANIELAPENVWDGKKYDFNIAAGGDIGDGAGNVMGYFGYRKMEAVRQDARDYSNCALVFTDAAGSAFGCGGSSTHAYGWFRPLTANPGALVNQNLANAKDGSKTWVPNDASFNYNYAPDNYTLRNSERYQAGAFANYKFNEVAEVYGSFMFMDDHSVSQVAPSAIWSGRAFDINCNNPFMSPSQATAMCGDQAGTATVVKSWVALRAATGTPRRNDMRHTNYRFTAGVRGDISEVWRYDANVMHATTVGQFNYQNDINQDKAAQALMAVQQGSEVVCIDSSKNCKPIDVFSANGPSAEGYAFIYAPTFTRDEQTIDVFNAYLSGDLGQYGIQSPWAKDGLALILGVEHRQETLDVKRDESQLTYASNADGKISVDEFFSELEVPLLSEKPMAYSLSTSFGYRTSKYNVSSSTTVGDEKETETWKAEVRYAPTPDILLRASYNKAVRAANISELFAAQGVGNVALIDPCSESQLLLAGKPTAAQCALTGVSADQYNNRTIPDLPADVGTALGGGNPNLDPEEAKTTTFGLVFTPRAIENLALSIDYWKIHIDGYIGSVPAQTAVSQCIANGSAFYCGLIHRDPTTGALFGSDINGGHVVSTNVNTGYLETKGVDFTGSYTVGTGYGSLNFSFVGTMLDSLETEVLPGLGSYDCTGLYGGTCGQPAPKWRHNLRTTWSPSWESVWAPTSVSLNWRYFGKVDLATNSDDQYLTGTKSTLNAEIEAYNYFDLAVTKDLPKGLVLRAGVNNLMDKAPPAIMGGLLVENGNGNTFPSVYDPLGRMFFIGISAAF